MPPARESRLPPGLTLFATPYDPLDLASDSIDPLGFQRGYVALADRLLPGFTTVTSVPRYLPMMCAGIRFAESLHPHDDGGEPAKARVRRMEVLREFEKLWALACGLVGEENGAASSGLRGLRYVRRFLASNANRAELDVRVFTLLSNQTRYGCIGIYGQMLDACHLVDWDSLTLRPLGEELARTFPGPPGWHPGRSSARFSKDIVRSWGNQVRIDIMPNAEARLLRKALSGGIEAEKNDDVRRVALHLLAKAGAQNLTSEAECLRKFAKLASAENPVGTREEAAVQQLRATASLLRPFEAFYQAVTFIFDEMRARATEDPSGCRVDDLEADQRIGDALSAAQRNMRELQRAITEAETVDDSVSKDFGQTLRESGITALINEVAVVTSATELALVLLRRHTAVQAGKFDRGQRKAPWIKHDGAVARLPSQRYQLIRAKHASSWQSVPWHPYRIYAAGRFIEQCRIT